MDILSISKKVKGRVQQFRGGVHEMKAAESFSQEKCTRQLGLLLQIRKEYREICQLIHD